MKKIYYLLFTSIFAGEGVQSQLPCYANCDNLVTKNIAYTESQPISYGKTNPTNYYDIEYDDACGNNADNNDYNCVTDAQNELQYKVFYPSLSTTAYNNCPRPAVILFHAGAYSDCSSAFGNDEYALMDEYCRYFASKGFVAFNCEYRRGNKPDPSSYYSAQQLLAFYRAFQDGRGAIKSIIKRQMEATSTSPFQIDIDNLFVGGASAGAAIALNVAYYPTQAMIDAVLGTDIKNKLGNINSDFYYGSSPSDNIQYFDRIKGVLNLWGNAFLPLNKASDPFSFFENNGNFPAIISFHGALDLTAYPFSKLVYFSPEPIGAAFDFKRETHCIISGTFTVPGSDENPDLITFGSSDIYDMLNDPSALIDIPNEFYFDCNMEHGLDKDDCTGCYNTDFGTNYDTRSQVTEYIVQRAATFFQAVIKNIANSLDHNKFVDCKNNRYGCSTGNSDAGCSNTDNCD